MDHDALRIALNALKQVPHSRRRVILNGDILDMEFLHKKNPIFVDNMKAKNFEFFAEELQKEYNWYRQFEETLLEVVRDRNDISFVMGNHEERVLRPDFYFKVPHAYRHHCEIREQLGFEDRVFVPYNDWLVLGDLYITHGMYCGLNPLKKHYADCHNNLLIGHTHEAGIQSFRGLHQTYITYNNPCLCGTDPAYLGGRTNNWSVGFTLVHYYKGLTHPQIHTIKDGVCILSDGTVLK